MPPLIVIAEDDDDIRAILTEVLESEGYRVLDAADGAAALDLVEREQPDLLLTDNMMPRLRGVDLIARLYAREGQSLPVILLSAVPPGQVPAPARFLPKPFDLGQLLGLVRGLLANP
jgi:two-component system response regulator MprA